AFALGICLATYFMRTEIDGRFDANGQPSFRWAVECVLWSAVIAGPLILLWQRFRGRRSPLSWCELLWLAPAFLSMLVFGFQPFQRSSEGKLATVILAVLIQCTLSFAGFLRLVSALSGTRQGIACRWTDFLGCSICMTVGPVILCELNQALGKL